METTKLNAAEIRKNMEVKCEIKWNAAYLIVNSRNIRCFGVEKSFSKRLGKVTYTGIGVSEFKTAKELKQYVIDNSKNWMQ